MDYREPVVITIQNQKIIGVFHRPEGNGPFPAVLVCHGLGGNKVGCCRLYVHIAQALAEKGIATLRIDFRGSGDSEGNFIDMTVESQINDAIAALNYLAQRPDVDSTHLGLMGCSFGGTIAIYAANRFKKVRSLSVWAPLLDTAPWYPKWEALNSPGITPKLKKELMLMNGQLAGYPFFQELFSLQIGKELKALHHLPMLHVHGEQDNVVHISHTELFEKARQDVLGESKLVKLPNSDHDFVDEDELQLALNETSAWFAKTL